MATCDLDYNDHRDNNLTVSAPADGVLSCLCGGVSGGSDTKDYYKVQQRFRTTTTFTTKTSARGLYSLFYALLIASLALLATRVDASESPPVFLVEPSSAVTKPYDPVTLHCRASSASGSLSISWTHNGSPITSDYETARGITLTYTVSQGSSTLSIASLKQRPKDQATVGVYNCLVSNAAGTVVSKDAILTKAVLENFDRNSDDIYINATEGNVALLPCATPFSEPPATTNFEVNTTIINRDTARHKLLPSGNLHIGSVKQTDQGIYHCSAYNDVTGTVKAAHNRIHLRIVAPTTNAAPKIIYSPKKDVTIVEGDTLTLECVAEGSPVPVVTWDKFGGIIPSRATRVLSNLVIDNVGVSDTGTYICRADNHFGQPSVEYSMVSVIERPRITQSPSNLVVPRGSMAQFDCVAPSTYESELSWLHNGVKLQSNSRFEITDTHLTIHNVQPSLHDGVYQCMIQNSLGGASSVATLKVVGNTDDVVIETGDKDEQRIPYEHMQDPQRNKNEGNQPANHMTPRPVTMTTRHKNHQGNNHYYAYNDYEEGEDDYVVDYDQSSFDQDPPRSKSRNRPKRPRFGTRSGNMKMSKPSRPEITKLSDTSVMVEWSIPNDGMRIYFYKVQYREMDSPPKQWETVEDDILSPANRYEVSGLMPGKVYRFRVVAVYENNDNMHGPAARFALEVEPAHRPNPPTDAPVLVEARSTSVSSIMIRWQYKPNDQSPVEGFIVHYQIYNAEGGFKKIRVLGAHMREHSLSQLIPDNFYSIKLQAFNSAGTSDFSNSVVKRTLAFLGEDSPGSRTLLPPVGGPPTSPPQGTEQRSVDRPENRVSTASSNQLLYVILGVVLGVMLLLLVGFMAMCSYKQRQQRRMMDEIGSHISKFNDTSRANYQQANSHPANKQQTLNGVQTSSQSPFLINTLVPAITQQQQQNSRANGTVPVNGPNGGPVMNIVENPLDSGDVTAECESDVEQNGDNYSPPYANPSVIDPSSYALEPHNHHMSTTGSGYGAQNGGNGSHLVNAYATSSIDGAYPENVYEVPPVYDILESHNGIHSHRMPHGPPSDNDTTHSDYSGSHGGMNRSYEPPYNQHHIIAPSPIRPAPITTHQSYHTDSLPRTPRNDRMNGQMSTTTCDHSSNNSHSSNGASQPQQGGYKQRRHRKRRQHKEPPMDASSNDGTMEPYHKPQFMVSPHSVADGTPPPPKFIAPPPPPLAPQKNSGLPPHNGDHNHVSPPNKVPAYNDYLHNHAMSAPIRT